MLTPKSSRILGKRGPRSSVLLLVLTLFLLSATLLLGACGHDTAQAPTDESSAQGSTGTAESPLPGTGTESATSSASESGTTSATSATSLPLTPLDNPSLPPRGYYMGLLPTPATGQTLAEAYRQVAETGEFVPVWGEPTPFWKLADTLAGKWGKTFVTEYARGNGLFPLVHMSFMGENLTLATPPGLAGATLKDEE